MKCNKQIRLAYLLIAKLYNKNVTVIWIQDQMSNEIIISDQLAARGPIPAHRIVHSGPLLHSNVDIK